MLDAFTHPYAGRRVKDGNAYGPSYPGEVWDVDMDDE
jgi:hypothetical protein